MKFIKKVLYLIFNERLYFRIISSFFFILYFPGLLKVSGKFRMHYFVRNLVRKGDTIIDIGANLGYYTSIFGRATGNDGMVWAVEPVPLYREILKRNTSRLSNIKILPFALGDRESHELMSIPGNQKYRHGLMRIEKNAEDGGQSIRVEVKTPSQLFANLDKVDYIKCDIEGYEDRVIPGLMDIIKRDRPIIQIELHPDNLALITDLLLKEGYNAYLPVGKGLGKLNKGGEIRSDILYIHDKRYEQIKNYIK
jgi:FkbM family methyltransferase